MDALDPTVNPKAYPLADPEVTARIHLVCNQAQHYDQLRKGANETVKALTKGSARLVVLAADADPLDIILHIPPLCEDKNVLYAFVPAKVALGRACGVPRPVVAAAIVNRPDSALEPQIVDLVGRFEQLFV